MSERIEVEVEYDAANWPAYDSAVFAAAGRRSDFSGMGFGRRDNGWVCGSEIEAARISRALKAIGLSPKTRPT